MQNPIIGIIGGKGRMGQLFADFFRAAGIKVIISDLNTKLTNQQLASQADITIVSVPIDKTIETIKKVLPHLKKGGAIMDFTSVKQEPIKAMLKGKNEVLGLHPMFGNSNPIPGQTIIVCPTKKSGDWSSWMQKFLKKNGAKLITMTPKEHDKTMSAAQGLIHFADIAFADSIRKTKMPVKELFKYASPASQLKTQLAARLIDQSSNLYGNIQIANPQNLKAIKSVLDSTKELYKIVAKKDLKKFEKYFQKNKEFFGNYTREAYNDSSYLIDRFFERKNTQKNPKPQKPSKKHLALLGPKNTYSDFAADKYLEGSKTKKFYCQTIDEVCELVKKQKVKEGIVPVENRLHGTVRETLDNLFHHDIKISQQIILPIDHSLITLTSAKKNDIKTIISHPQALSQCKKYLKRNFPKAKLKGYPSTASAMAELSKTHDKSLAAIASPRAISNAELKVFKSNIADSKDNATTFLVIGPKGSTQGSKTSIAFYFDKDSPGSLAKIFKEFAAAKINLTKIESRPTKADYGQYIFFLDFEGSQNEPKIKKVLASIKKQVAKLKTFGSY